MKKIHYALWDRCHSFVKEVCATRDASHGLGHMQKVTEQAVLLYLMSGEASQHVQNMRLYQIIVVGMLHDVADHKYDFDGTLLSRVESFVDSEAEAYERLARDGDNSRLLFGSAVEQAAIVGGGAAAFKKSLMTSLDAISYSKENKRGMRWFEKDLPNDWLSARDYVSDADKIEAIGEEGLMRCYEYTCHRYRETARQCKDSAATAPAGNAHSAAAAVITALEAKLLTDVSDHYDEKLCRLYTEFIVTETGKYIAAPRHEAMSELLQAWKKQGPPPVTLFWREAADEYALTQ